ncbi:heavy metal-associated isoprenylated plant protein 7-like [Cornus florida]|uniref:heavy metal-associated isoprenylated plant protein 7-like n=1 Tax=Cornus florida TaxID=4283 RepID=UPI0028A14D1D|nr:heavy metal-associated isoprenylated plant protein 7-like [Cornus florida]
MGEEEKKPEEKKPEEGKEEAKPEKPKEEKKAEESKEPPPPPPPQEIVLRVYMHCEGCARKIRRSLKTMEGIEDVQTDCKTHKVVVKGEKADPFKVVERVERKSHRQVDLLSPIPKPPPAEEAKKTEEKAPPKPEEKKEEPKVVIIVVLKVHMHCEACAQQLKRRIQRMQGVENAEPDLKSSQVTVKGVFDPPKLVEYVKKRTGKHAVIVKVEPQKKVEEKPKEEKKEEEVKKVEGDQKKDGGGGGEAAPAPAGAEEGTKVVDTKTNELLHHYFPLNYHAYPPKYAPDLNYQVYPPNFAPELNYHVYPPNFATEMYHPSHPYPPPHAPQISYPYPPHAPQMFSDENPNGCSVM